MLAALPLISALPPPVVPLLGAAVLLQVVKVLAEAGADLNLPENRGWTALMIAASRGCVESIEALLGESSVSCCWQCVRVWA